MSPYSPNSSCKSSSLASSCTLVTSIIQPSIERTATAPEEVCWSVVEGLEPLRGGELSISISLDAMFEDVWGEGGDVEALDE